MVLLFTKPPAHSESKARGASAVLRHLPGSREPAGDGSASSPSREGALGEQSALAATQSAPPWQPLRLTELVFVPWVGHILLLSPGFNLDWSGRGFSA